MRTEWAVECLALLVTAIVSLIVAFLIRRKSDIPGVRTLCALMVAVAGWSLVAGLEAAVPGFRLKLLFSTLEYVGSGSAAALLLQFAVQHAGKGEWLAGRTRVLLWLLPAVNVGLVATNAVHGLVWSGFSHVPDSTLLIYEHGVGFYGILAGIYLYITVATFFLLRTALRPSALPRRQAIAILAGIPIPWAASLIYAAVPGAFNGLNITPLAFFFVGCMLAVSITRWRVFDLTPIARDVLVEQMEDAFVVIDAAGNIVDRNRAATEQFGIGARQVGRKAECVLPFWGDLQTADGHVGSCCTRLEAATGAARHVLARLTPVDNRDGTHLGSLVMLHDITLRHQTEQALRETNEALRRKLLENERLQRELRDQALRDPLTGLRNRRYLEDVLPVEVGRAEESGAPLSLVVVDIDRFKSVNDAHGHARGDEMLNALGGLIQQRLSEPQSAGRYGGDEFMVILPNTGLDAAVSWAESLRRLFEPIAAAYNGSIRAATLSAGVASYPEHGASGADLFHTADVALYEAKNSGRNCVCVGSVGVSISRRFPGCCSGPDVRERHDARMTQERFPNRS